ncbi:hypothetical protein [Pseudotamlana agarivorans]|uniref:hypothetical protein n=1 Tax=Pseudotamlana agarivorans TaxID=481183 RepID=UPI0008353E39|nr:hypothetical protein [Tamlana agarivorans]
MKKIIFAALLFIGLALSGFAQSEKLIEKANQKVEELNTDIITGDKTQALSEAQKSEIQKLYIERTQAIRKAKKAGADDTETKAIIKNYNQKVFKEVLTKEQIKARKKGKEQEEN